MIQVLKTQMGKYEALDRFFIISMFAMLGFSVFFFAILVAAVTALPFLFLLAVNGLTLSLAGAFVMVVLLAVFESNRT